MKKMGGKKPSENVKILTFHDNDDDELKTNAFLSETLISTRVVPRNFSHDLIMHNYTH